MPNNRLFATKAVVGNSTCASETAPWSLGLNGMRPNGIQAHARGCYAMIAMPRSVTAPPAMSQLLGRTPSTDQSHPSATAT